MRDEIFGPILIILTVDSIKESIRFVKTREKPLVVYIFSEDQNEANFILSSTSSGSACVNETLLQNAIPSAPFGGVGNSGFGKIHGRYGFENFSNKKTVMIRSKRFDFDARYPPYTAKKVAFVETMSAFNFDFVKGAIDSFWPAAAILIVAGSFWAGYVFGK